MSGFLSSGSRHSWVEFKSSECTTNIFYVPIFSNLHGSVFMTFTKREQIERDVKCTFPPINAALETLFALAFTSLFLSFFFFDAKVI